MEIKIGNIKKVKWHYRWMKTGGGIYGHARESYCELNEAMDITKNYAYIYVKNEKIFVRNLFVSSDPKGFSQKNTYFEDQYNEMLLLEDTNNLLLEYIKKGNSYIIDLSKQNNNDELYFCVEYEIKEGFNDGLLNYLVMMDFRYASLEFRLKKIEEEIKTETLKKKKWFYK